MTGVDLAALRALAEKATPGPWEQGDVWLRAGVMDELHGEGKCAFCGPCGDPVLTGMDDINGKRMVAHKHRNPEPYEPNHLISGPDGQVAGNYDYESGGIIEPTDAAFIAACDPQTVLALVEAVEAALRWARADNSEELMQAARQLRAALAPFRQEQP